VKARFTRRYHLSASHRLHAATLSAEQNQTVYGKCNNPHGHGHNYRVAVTVGGEVDGDTGMIINMAELDGMVREQVLDRFDHANLNCDPAFREAVPTTENLARVIHGLLAPRLQRPRLLAVRIEVTENNFFEYAGVPGEES
jgi:6-pyruvoyltetrahydropterin/6-carboxytetrahydropterin synthase